MLLPPLDCICLARDASLRREQQQRLVYFLFGLNDSFETTRSQILMLDPLPTVEKAYSMIVQVEDQKLVSDDVIEYEGRMAMNLRRQGNFKTETMNNYKRRLTKEERRQLKCTHCHETGHGAHECFKLHSYPDWYKRYIENHDKNRINYIDNDGDTGSETSRSQTSDTSSEISRIIQFEIAKSMSNLMPKNNGACTSTNINMVHSEGTSSNPFDGHFAFSVVPSMDKALK